MKTVLFFGLSAAFFFGVNPILYKLAVSSKKADPFMALAMYGLGVFLFGMVAFLVNRPCLAISWPCAGYGIGAGLLYGAGLLFVAVAFGKGIPAALLVPIFTTNALICVLLGIFLLHEVPDIKGIIRIVAGTTLIVAGAIVVSLYKS